MNTARRSRNRTTWERHSRPGDFPWSVRGRPFPVPEGRRRRLAGGKSAPADAAPGNRAACLRAPAGHRRNWSGMLADHWLLIRSEPTSRGGDAPGRPPPKLLRCPAGAWPVRRGNRGPRPLARACPRLISCGVPPGRKAKRSGQFFGGRPAARTAAKSSRRARISPCCGTEKTKLGLRDLGSLIGDFWRDCQHSFVPALQLRKNSRATSTASPTRRQFLPANSPAPNSPAQFGHAPARLRPKPRGFFPERGCGCGAPAAAGWPHATPLIPTAACEVSASRPSRWPAAVRLRGLAPGSFPLCVLSDLCGVPLRAPTIGAFPENTAEIGKNAERGRAAARAPCTHCDGRPSYTPHPCRSPSALVAAPPPCTTALQNPRAPRGIFPERGCVLGAPAAARWPQGTRPNPTVACAGSGPLRLVLGGHSRAPWVAAAPLCTTTLQNPRALRGFSPERGCVRGAPAAAGWRQGTAPIPTGASEDSGPLRLVLGGHSRAPWVAAPPLCVDRISVVHQNRLDGIVAVSRPGIAVVRR